MTSDELYNLLQNASDPYHINIDAFNIHNLPQDKFNQLLSIKLITIRPSNRFIY